MLQQKIEVDIVEKREQQLTVFKKSSIDPSEDDQSEMLSTLVHVDDVDSKVNALKKTQSEQ